MSCEPFDAVPCLTVTVSRAGKATGEAPHADTEGAQAAAADPFFPRSCFALMRSIQGAA